MRYVSSNSDLDEPASAAWCNTCARLISASFLNLAFAYVVAGVMVATHGQVSRQSLSTIVAALWMPLRMFLPAAAPTCVTGFLFWLERGRTIGERRRGLLRGLAILIAGVAIVACAAGTQQ
jgi:hypothetical protein